MKPKFPYPNVLTMIIIALFVIGLEHLPPTPKVYKLAGIAVIIALLIAMELRAISDREPQAGTSFKEVFPFSIRLALAGCILLTVLILSPVPQLMFLMLAIWALVIAAIWLMNYLVHLLVRQIARHSAKR
ncbi:MAG: hypothetical protein ACYC1M_10705 [Armatimonadota bacterium]